jgi:membrane protease YdiL (CAAX protease family)
MIKKTKKEGVMIMTLVVVVCLAMAYVEIVLAPGYAVKSGIKIALFLALPLILLLLSKKASFSKFFRMKKSGWRASGVMAAITFLGILGAYLLFRGNFDFSSVAPILQNQLGINGRNFIPVALYISFINSFLEEFFFRGFAFLALLKTTDKKVAYAFSATAFALYHVAIMIGWFSLPLMALLILSLLFAGFLFNYIDEKKGSILPSWIVHISANFAINAIGFILLGIVPGF